MKIYITYLFLLIIQSIAIAQLPPPPILQPGEQYTNLWSVTYDFQSNGSIRYLVQNPANPVQWCAVLMAQHDSSVSTGINRFIYYSYSNDNGINWEPGAIDTSTNYGFPCITLSNGIPVIACHKSSSVGTFVFKEKSFGVGSFSQITPVPVLSAPPIWPHIAGTSNGNLVLAAAEGQFFGENSVRTTFNGSSWSPFVSIPLTTGPSGNFDIVSGSNGKAAIVGSDYANESNALSWYESVNNGMTFNNGSVIMNYILTGGDTLYANAVGGYQAVYDNLGFIHIVFAAFNINNNSVFPNYHTLDFIKPSLYHWSSQTNTFTQVAGKFNIPNLADTITQDKILPICQPTFSITASGKLVCAYTVYLRGNTQVVQNGDVVNTGEIFYSESLNNGILWSTPQNLTNTPGIEEKHPSMPPYTSTDSLRLFYIRDMKAGGVVLVNEWGKAPVYGIFNNLIINHPPPAPFLMDPQNNSIHNSITPLLKWQQSATAVSYKVQISLDNEFNNIILDQDVTTNEFNIPSSILNYNNLYYWRVNASNSNGSGTWSSIWSFRTTTFLPPAPELVSPLNEAVEISFTPTLDWSDAPFASGFNLQVSEDSLFSNPIINHINLSSSQFIIPGSILTTFTDYYWKVNSANSNGTGSWSVSWKFRTVSLPIAPVLLVPANDTTGVSESPVLRWNSISNADKYRLFLSVDSNFTNLIVNDSNITQTSYHVYPVILNINTIYYWKVKAINDAGSGPWSEAWRFRTTLTSGINLISSNVPDKYFISDNYPNPFNPSTNLEFGISELGLVSLKIYNALGKEVATIVNEVLPPGKYSYQFSTVNYQLSSGIYFYRLESGGFVETKRMILLK